MRRHSKSRALRESLRKRAAAFRAMKPSDPGTDQGGVPSRFAATSWPLVVLGLMSAAGALGVAIAEASGRQVDFDVYRMGAAHVLGQHLYEVHLAALHLHFTYPPFAALLFWPFTQLPVHVGQLVLVVAQPRHAGRADRHQHPRGPPAVVASADLGHRGDRVVSGPPAQPGPVDTGFWAGQLPHRPSGPARPHLRHQHAFAHGAPRCPAGHRGRAQAHAAHLHPVPLVDPPVPGRGHRGGDVLVVLPGGRSPSRRIPHCSTGQRRSSTPSGPATCSTSATRIFTARSSG